MGRFSRVFDFSRQAYPLFFALHSKIRLIKVKDLKQNEFRKTEACDREGGVRVGELILLIFLP